MYKKPCMFGNVKYAVLIEISFVGSSEISYFSFWPNYLLIVKCSVTCSGNASKDVLKFDIIASSKK
jgi:hypothetical protein